MAKPRCTSKTKAGKPCRAAPLKGTKHCAAHDPDTPASTRFGGPEQARAAGELGGRPRNPRVVDVMRARVEDRIDEVLAAYFDALKATRPVMVGHGENAVIVDIPDHRTRLKAADSMLDRVYGRPRQAHEHTGPEGGAIPFAAELRAPEVREAMFEVLKRVDSARSR